MNLLNNYEQYTLEKLLMESVREMKLVLSKRFRDILYKINSDISDELLKSHNDLNFKTKQTFIDINMQSDDSITFILANKAADILDIENEEDMDNNTDLKIHLRDVIDVQNDLYTKQRGSMKLGRFINATFPNKFPASLRAVAGEKIKDVENFVNAYKSLTNQTEKFKFFDLVEGDEISTWYNYRKYRNREGTMGNSCMSDVPSSYLELYDSNPEIVKMLILYTDDTKTKIKGRALVWSLSKPANKTFMERVYVNNSGDIDLFIAYAKMNGWLYKTHQSYGSDCDVVDPETSTTSRLIMKVMAKPEHYDKYPYMDTFQFYNPNTGLLSNRKTGCKYYLTSTGGYADDLGYDDEATIFSNYHNEEIVQHDAVWCIYGEDWVLRDQALRVFNSGRDAAPGGDGHIYAVPGHPDIVRCNIPKLGINKHFPKEKCVWSDFHNTWIFYDSVRKVWLNKNRKSKNFVLDHKKGEGKFFAKVARSYYDINLLKKNPDGTYEFKD